MGSFRLAGGSFRLPSVVSRSDPAAPSRGPEEGVAGKVPRGAATDPNQKEPVEKSDCDVSKGGVSFLDRQHTRKVAPSLRKLDPTQSEKNPTPSSETDAPPASPHATLPPMSPSISMPPNLAESLVVFKGSSDRSGVSRLRHHALAVGTSDGHLAVFWLVDVLSQA